MNGLEILDEKLPSLADKLMRREPRENAYIEIHNVIARAPLHQITRDDIESILSEHEITVAEVKPRLTNIYIEVLRHFVKDFQLSDDEAANLAHLRDLLLLSGAETGHIHASVLYPIFQNAVRNAVFDGRLTSEEKDWLNNIAHGLKIPEEFISQLYTPVVREYMQAKLNAALADNRLTPDEERELAEISSNLQTPLGVGPNVHAALDRARYLWRLESGELPRAQVPVYLKQGEFCAAFAQASYHQMQTVTTGVKYNGYGYSGATLGMRYRSGTIRTQRITQNIMQRLDFGILYFTNRRLLFNGSQGSTEISLGNIIGATFYRDGMLVERGAGKDQTFLFSGDIEAIQIIFDTLMTNFRQ